MKYELIEMSYHGPVFQYDSKFYQKVVVKFGVVGDLQGFEKTEVFDIHLDMNLSGNDLIDLIKNEAKNYVVQKNTSI